MPNDEMPIRRRVGTRVRQHQRAAGVGVTVSALALFGIAVVLGWAILNGPGLSGEADATPTVAQPIPSSEPTDASSTPTATPAPSPTSTPPTSSSASFNILPAQQPADFVSSITCNGPIGASDPVAVVELATAVEYTTDRVLRNYADPGSPRTVCHFGQHWVEQLIDARHVVIGGSGGTYAVVDLPEVLFHWFHLPPGTFLAVSPGLDEILWLSHDQLGSGMDSVHITTSAGDRVIASVPGSLGGRCGTPEDSKQAAYTKSGAHLFVLDQPMPDRNSLLVVEGESVLLSVIPPSAGWPQGSWPAMAVWSPISETLFYRQGGDVWQWTPAGGTQRYLPGVNWYFPTITPDGRHLAYSVLRADGLHNVYLIDLADTGSPQLIGEARNLPVFVNSTQLWFKSEGQGMCGHGSDEPLIYNITDGSESPSIIDWVRHVWPATSSNF